MPGEEEMVRDHEEANRLLRDLLRAIDGGARST